MTEALKRADVIVAGPGSLYTSILPPLLVPEVAAGMSSSRAIRILVANLMTEYNRHNPDGLASAIKAVVHGKLGAWRTRAEAGGV